MELYVRDEETGTYSVANRNQVRSKIVELGRKLRKRTSISNPETLMEMLETHLSLRQTEVFLTIFVDNANKILSYDMTEGVEEQCAIYPRNICRQAILLCATGVIVAHNHPTGNVEPSKSDLSITSYLQAALEACGTRLLDHIIVSDSEKFYSFRQNGML